MMQIARLPVGDCSGLVALPWGASSAAACYIPLHHSQSPDKDTSPCSTTTAPPRINSSPCTTQDRHGLRLVGNPVVWPNSAAAEGQFRPAV